MVLWVVTGGDAYDGRPLVEDSGEEWERQGVPAGESVVWRGVSLYQYIRSVYEGGRYIR